MQLPFENEHCESENESDVALEQSPPKWTPLPLPNTNYILWNTMSMLSKDYINEREKDISQLNVLPSSQEVQIEKNSDILEPTHYGEVGKVPVEEGEDSFNMLTEDEQVFAALMEQDFGDELKGKTKEELVGQSDVKDEVTLFKEPERHVERSNSDMEGDDAFNISMEEEQVFSALSQENFDTIPSQCTHQLQESTSVPSPGNVDKFNNIPSTLSTFDSKKDNTVNKSPVDVYKIDSDSDNMSIEDLNRIDKDIELFIENSQESSSSDDIPPVQWDRHSTTKTKHSSKSRAKWLPVSDSISASCFPPKSASIGSRSSSAPSNANCIKSDSSKVNIKGEFSGASVQSLGSVAGSGSHHLAVEQCLICYFKFPPRYVPCCVYCM